MHDGYRVSNGTLVVAVYILPANLCSVSIGTLDLPMGQRRRAVALPYVYSSFLPFTMFTLPRLFTAVAHARYIWHRVGVASPPDIQYFFPFFLLRLACQSVSFYSWVNK